MISFAKIKYLMEKYFNFFLYFIIYNYNFFNNLYKNTIHCNLNLL